MKQYFEEKPENAQKFADGFVSAAHRIKGEVLDYSPQSIRQVEDIIDSFRRDGAPIHQMGDTFFSIGCYLGEVFVRNGYGQWVSTSSTPMKGFSSAAFVLQLSATSFCNPIDKVVKRAENGKEDSLTHFFETFAAKSAPQSDKKCPKCTYVRSSDDVAPDWQCPSCGIAYEKFRSSTSGADSPPKYEADARRASAPIMLCEKYIISKSRLLQTTETTGAVLLSKDAIYFARKNGFGLAVGLGGIYGGAIGGVLAGAATTMMEQFVTSPRLKSAGAIPFDQLPPAIQDYLTRLKISGDVVVLPREAVKEKNVTFWRGAFFKTDSHLFELRPGLFDFGNVRKRLAFYKWI